MHSTNCVVHLCFNVFYEQYCDAVWWCHTAADSSWRTCLHPRCEPVLNVVASHHHGLQFIYLSLCLGWEKLPQLGLWTDLFALSTNVTGKWTFTITSLNCFSSRFIQRMCILVAWSAATWMVLWQVSGWKPRLGGDRFNLNDCRMQLYTSVWVCVGARNSRERQKILWSCGLGGWRVQQVTVVGELPTGDQSQYVPTEQ